MQSPCPQGTLVPLPAEPQRPSGGRGQADHVQPEVWSRARRINATHDDGMGAVRGRAGQV